MLQIKNTLGGGKPEGLYAWKKYSTLDVFLEKYISTTEQKNNIFPYSSSNVLYKSSSYTFDKNTGIYTLVNPTSVSGAILQNAVHMYNGEYFMLNANSGATMYKAPTRASQESGVTASNSAYNGFSIQTYGNYKRAPYYIYSNKSGTERTFISCIVANDESAYPDGGEKGGYWYEKIFEINPQMFGCTKMAIDYKIWASASSSISYDHSLGEAPKVAILTCGGNAPLTGSGVLTDICLGSYWVYNRLVDGIISTGSNSTDASLGETSVSHSNINGNTFAGVKYTIITMA